MLLFSFLLRLLMLLISKYARPLTWNFEILNNKKKDIFFYRLRSSTWSWSLRRRFISMSYLCLFLFITFFNRLFSMFFNWFFYKFFYMFFIWFLKFVFLFYIILSYNYFFRKLLSLINIDFFGILLSGLLISFLDFNFIL